MKQAQLLRKISPDIGNGGVDTAHLMDRFAAVFRAFRLAVERLTRKDATSIELWLRQPDRFDRAPKDGLCVCL
jgi:hypothetical protein